MKDQNPESEVLELATDVEGETPVSEIKGEGPVVVLAPTFAVAEPSSEAPEAETKWVPSTVENRMFTAAEELPSTVKAEPKAEKVKKPCPLEQEMMRKEELKRLEEVNKFVEEIKTNCDVPFYQAMVKSFEKAKRYRVIVRVRPQAMPASAEKNLEVVTGPDESEF